MHYAMAAFESTILRDKETSTVWDPSLRVALKTFIQAQGSSSNTVYVTKRNINWYKDNNIRKLAADTVRGDIGIICMVRDPRDVLTSTHMGSKRKGYYLAPELWAASIHASDDLFAMLPSQARFLVVRYEDLILRSAEVREKMEVTFGLRFRAELDDWAKLEENLKRSKIPTALSKALHGVRNFDANSIGKWRTNPQHLEYFEGLLNGRVGSELKAFMKRYKYN